MADTIDSVNSVIVSLGGWAQNSKEPTATTCRQHINALEAAIKEIERLRAVAAPMPTKLGDLSDLPEELRAELSGVEIDEFQSQLITVINSYGGVADLNQVLVGLFRKFQVVQTRRFAQQKLWRMTTDGVVWTVPKRKGVYTTKSPAATTDANGPFGASVFGSTIFQPKPKPKPKDDDDIPF